MSEIPEWYKVYEVTIVVRDILGSMPADPEQLKHIKRIYGAMAGPGKEGEKKAEELMDATVEEGEEVAWEERAAGRCVFRRNALGDSYLSQGQIVGWVEEAIKAANLSRVIKNVALTFWTEPNRLILPKPDGEVIRPVRGFVGGKFLTTLAMHEKISKTTLNFKLLTTNTMFTEKNAEKVLDLARRVNLGPGRQHGYGEIEELQWKKIQ